MHCVLLCILRTAALPVTRIKYARVRPDHQVTKCAERLHGESALPAMGSLVVIHATGGAALATALALCRVQ